MSKDPVVHFEMPVRNRKRVSKFYSTAFGWSMIESGAEMGHYIMAHTGETDKNGMPQKPGFINGGFYTEDPKVPAPYPSVVIAVKNIEDSMKKIKKAGGKILGKPMDIPGVGKYVSFTDTEGNRVSILQPSM